MARWQLLGPWPHGSITIPASTEIVGTVDANGNITASWNHMPIRFPMPIDAKAMDDEAALQMLQSYDEAQWHRLLYGPGVNVETMKSKAAELASTARYPRQYVPAKG
jgi:hypothetical protein